VIKCGDNGVSIEPFLFLKFLVKKFLWLVDAFSMFKYDVAQEARLPNESRAKLQTNGEDAILKGIGQIVLNMKGTVLTRDANIHE
jgi:hypothetical protein